MKMPPLGQAARHRALVVPAHEPQLVPADRMPIAHYVRPFTEWLALVLERSPATVESYGDALNSFVEFCEAERVQTPDEVRPKTVQRYLVTLRHQRGRAASTVNHRRCVLITFYRYLAHEEIVTFNPAAAALGLKTAKRLPDFMTPTEQRRVLETLSQARRRRGQRDFVLIALMMLTGLRASEACNLRIASLDLDTGILRVVEGKGRKDRLIPVIPWLAGVLRWYLADVRPAFVKAPDVEHVFLGPAGDRPLTRPGLWALVRRAVSPILGRPVHPHTLRHTFASRALEGGGNLVALGMAMGHESPSTTAIYAHIPDPEYRAKLASWLTTGLDEIKGPWNQPAPAAVPELPPTEADNDEAETGPAAWSLRRAAYDAALRAQLRQMRRSRRRRRT